MSPADERAHVRPDNLPDNLEVEAKFQLSPEEYEALFAEEITLDGLLFQARSILWQTDIYLDTSIYDLLRHGIALRIRGNNSSYEAGIKSIQSTRKGATLERIDIAFPLQANDDPFNIKKWPKALRERLEQYAVKLRDLRPRVVVRQQRQKKNLVHAESGRALAEWSLDRVWIDGAIDSSAEPLSAEKCSYGAGDFHELEIERLPNTQDVNAQGANEQEDHKEFLTLVKQVQDQLDLQPIYSSKLVRGLEVAFAHTHANNTHISPLMPLEAASRLLLHQQLFQILLNEHGVRDSKKARYVHDMRVAIRRARAAIQLCHPVIPAKVLAPHDKGLRRLGRALGTVRDLDVALANLRAFRRQQPPSQHKAIKQLRNELRNRRRHARTDLFSYLNSKKHRNFIRGLIEFCVTPAKPASAEGDPYEVFPVQVRHTMPSLILAAFEAVRAYETALCGDALPPIETFHALRLRAKYLRYLLEFSRHLLGKDGDSVLAHLRQLQEELGNLNDAHVEQLRLQQWTEKVHDDALRAAINMRLSSVNECIHRLTKSAPALLGRMIDLDSRQTLGNALARL